MGAFSFFPFGTIFLMGAFSWASLLHQFIIRFVIKLEKTSIEYFGEKRKSKDVYLPFCLALSIKCFQITIEI